MAHLTRLTSPLAVVATFTLACGGSEARQAGDQGAKDSAARAADMAASAERRVSSVMIGRRIGTGNRIIEPTFEFTPSETVYVSLATAGTEGAGTLTAAWRSQDGQIIHQASQPVSESENTAFELSQPKGLKPGTYKVVLFLGDDSIDTKVFVVKK